MSTENFLSRKRRKEVEKKFLNDINVL